nr:hypothetical protein [Mesorhizobium sp.]
MGDLLQRMGAKPVRRGFRLFQHMHEQFEFGQAVDHAVTRNRLDQPVGIVLRDIARRLFLNDEVGDGFDEKIRPSRAFVPFYRVERKQRLGLAPRHHPVAEHLAAQHDHVFRCDPIFRGQLGHRSALQFAHFVSHPYVTWSQHIGSSLRNRQTAWLAKTCR